MQTLYLEYCKAAYNEHQQRENIAVFFIEKSDYVGTLVHTSLVMQKEYAEFFSDKNFIVAHLPKSIGKELVQQIFASLSQDFYVENFNLLDQFIFPTLIFSGSTSTVIDLQKN